MRRTIKALEDEKEKAEREVSLFDEQFFTSYADVQNFKVFGLQCLEFQSVWPARAEQNNK